MKPAMHLVLFICLFFMMNCGKTDNEIPESLLGIWVTDEERYQDRYIEFTHETIIFGTDTATPNLYFVKNVEQKLNGHENEYTFNCKDLEDTEFRFIFHVEENRNSFILRLNNPREVVWKRAPVPVEPILTKPSD